ncbi:MAG: queuosine precursor transporter [Bacteroidota bacterium]|nr:queuosine precursor transporter [Bacteroidota bacterium]
MENKVRRVFIILSAFFLTNVLIAEFIGIKIFSLERSLGYEPVNWRLLGDSAYSFNLTAGVLLWPFVFILTDIINEYFGRKGVRLLSYLAVIMILYAFLMVTLAMGVMPADFWVVQLVDGGSINMEKAFNAVFGQGRNIIIASVSAFFIGQIIDVYVFQFLRKYTGSRRIWLRATGSTAVSQLIDSYVVLLIAFYLSGPHWPLELVLSIGLMNYIYKMLMAVLLTPLLYLLHFWIDNYLGKNYARKLSALAASRS